MSLDSGTHHLGTHAMVRLVIAAVLALALILTLEVSPAAATSPKTCRVTNTDSGRTYPRLQQAVDAAKPGAHLALRGTCHGPTVIDRDIVISGVPTEVRGKPILRGVRGSVTIKVEAGVRVSLRGLVVGGPTRLGPGGPTRLGPSRGIANRGALTLRDVIVRDGHTLVGSGILNRGALRTWGRTLIWGNGYGGALYNTGHATLGGTTRISRNYGCLRNLGVLVMNDASSIDSCRIDFGADRLWNDGSLVMNDSSSIWGTGGVWNRGDLTLNDASSIHDNLHRYRMGPGVGGGVLNEGTLTMTGSSSIHHNDAVRAGHGGGIYNVSGGTLVGVNCAPQTYANVYGNTPDDCYFESP